jgi:hypothetical protein
MAGEPKVWCIRWDNLVLSENDITIGQAERIEKLTGESWLRLNPLRSAKHAAAIATVMVGDALGKSEDDMAVEVRNVKVSDFLTELLTYGDDDTPETHQDGNPPVAGTLTNTSRTSGKNLGAGLQPSSDSNPSGTSG